jgi:hypothetical protein
LVVYLTAIETLRLVGAVFLLEWSRGNLPAVFAIPAGVGDVLVALTAPLVALSLRRPGRRRWAVAIAWNALGITDLVYAIALAAGSGAVAFIAGSYLVFIPAIFVPISVAVHLVVLSRLLRSDLSRWYVSEGPATS